MEPKQTANRQDVGFPFLRHLAMPLLLFLVVQDREVCLCAGILIEMHIEGSESVFLACYSSAASYSCSVRH